MIEVIERKKVPFYETECFECKSKLRFTKADVCLMHITCPVCGMSNNVVPVSPDGYYDKGVKHE